MLLMIDACFQFFINVSNLKISSLIFKFIYFQNVERNVREVTQTSGKKRGVERQEGDILSRQKARELLPGVSHNKADFVQLIGPREKFM